MSKLFDPNSGRRKMWGAGLVSAHIWIDAGKPRFFTTTDSTIAKGEVELETWASFMETPHCQSDHSKREVLVLLPEDMDTIAAISTADGVGAIGIVRISGPDAIAVADALFSGRERPSQMKHSTLQFGKVLSDGNVIDEVVLSVMRAPRSFTGEDMVEISCHGNPLILRDVLRVAIASGARLATGGEFTRRAFINGKMDLCQAEAVMKLLSAETDEARRVAFAQMKGAMSESITRLNRRLIEAKAILDASIDFPGDLADEAEIECEGAAASDSSNTRSARPSLLLVKGELERMIAAFDKSQRLQRASRVAIVGKANVGKSTVLNSLIGQDRMITSETPGTTRDRVDVELSLPSGRRSTLSDSAGLSPERNELDAKARRKMEEGVEDADALLIVFDVSRPLEQADREILTRFGKRASVIALNKTDLGQRWDSESLQLVRDAGHQSERLIKTCAVSGLGIDDLRTALDDCLAELLPTKPSESLVAGTVRNRALLAKASDAVGRAILAISAKPWPEFASQDLSDAIDALHELLGIEVGFDILDEVFSRFCIGK
ncbi:tRNA uridine-5-carboxymethylaminomethyl(34) synthesis GTPase MnmE [bacterium]|nr:tRNA uridine-5-carboxymethylaminomethyl(34) synthesis GTPase MnmE [bacterium]